MALSQNDLEAYKSRIQTPIASGGDTLLRQRMNEMLSKGPTMASQPKPTVQPIKTTPLTPIKITPTAKKVPLTFLQQAQQTVTDIGTKVGGAVGKLASFLPEKNAPIKITPGQKKVDMTQLKQLEGYKHQVESATLTTQAKQQTIQKLKAVQEKYKTKPIEEVRRQLPKGYKEPGALREIADILSEGFTNLGVSIGSSAEMIGNVDIPFIRKNILLTKAGEKIRRESENILAANPEWAADPAETWGARKLARVTLAVVPSILANVVARLVAGTPGTVATGFALEAGPTYKEAKEAGASETKAQVYGVTVGTVNGILESLFGKSVLAPQTKVVKEGIKKIGKELILDLGKKVAKGAAVEATTEGLQEIWSNVIATNYDKNRKVWDNVLESFVGGFLGGGVVGGGIESVQNKLTQNLQAENDPQTVINEVLKQGAENTEEGKKLMKDAVQAQKTGEKVVIEKTPEQIAQEEADRTLLTSEQAKQVETQDTEYTKQVREKISKLEEDINLTRQENEVKKSILDQFEGKTIQGMRTLKRSMMSIEEKGRDYQTDIKKLPSYNKTIYDVMAAIGTNSEDEAIRYIREDLPGTIVKADTKQALQEIKVLKSHIKPTEVSVPRSQLPVGEGKQKISKLEARMKGVLGNATPEQIEQLGLSTRNVAENDKQIAKASEYIINNRKDAIAVLEGEKDAPPGILRNALFVAMAQEAKTDMTLATKLASLSATRYGQELQILSEIDKNSPVKLLNEVYKVKEEEATKKYKDLNKARKNGVENIKKEIKTVNKYDWNAFLDTITC